MALIRHLKNDKPQIIKNEAFCTLLQYNLPDWDQPIDKLFLNFDNKIKEVDSRITNGALNNAHGDWYEWLLAISAWNYCAKNLNVGLPLLTPNIRRFDINISMIGLPDNICFLLWLKQYTQPLYNTRQNYFCSNLTSSKKLFFRLDSCPGFLRGYLPKA